MNVLSTVGAFIIGASFLFFLGQPLGLLAPPGARPVTTPGTAAGSSGSPRRRRRTTTTPRCRRSGRSGRPGTTTIPSTGSTTVRVRSPAPEKEPVGAPVMRVDGLFLVGIGVFFGIIAGVYWFTSYEDARLPDADRLGSARAVARLVLPVVVVQAETAGRRRPRRDVAEGAGEVESFPGSSIWPFLLGMGAMFAVLTFVFGLWLAPLAAALIVSAAIGATVESRRGGAV